MGVCGSSAHDRGRKIELMGDAWLGWLAMAVGLALLILLTVAGYAAMGILLAAAIVLAGRHAITPDAGASIDDVLRQRATGGSRSATATPSSGERSVTIR